MRKEDESDMTQDKVLYTDGREVTVTDSTLQVKNQAYKLNGVTRCGLMVLEPQRAPGIIMLILGIAFIVAGLMKLFPAGIIPNVTVANATYGVNTISMWAGGAMALIGILVLGLMRERYSVRIQTAEGEKDAVVSEKKEYISQIVDAINQAITYVRTKSASRYFTIRSASPSR